MSTCFGSCIPHPEESYVFQQYVGPREKDELTDEELLAAQISYVLQTLERRIILVPHSVRCQAVAF